MGDRDARWTGFILPPPTARWRLRESVATTDAEGRFELGPRVTADAFVGLRGDAILFCPEHPLDASADPAALEIVVDAASRFHVALRDADEADAFATREPRRRGGRLLRRGRGPPDHRRARTIDASGARATVGHAVRESYEARAVLGEPR
jgi:hypothetical protein